MRAILTAPEIKIAILEYLAKDGLIGKNEVMWRIPLAIQEDRTGMKRTVPDVANMTVEIELKNTHNGTVIEEEGRKLQFETKEEK